MTFQELLQKKFISLYAGDLPTMSNYRNNKVGLSLSRNDNFHIKHDVRNRLPIPDNTVDIYQSEDVFEHIEYDLVKGIIFEIYRVLKKGALFRLSLPDYRCDILYKRSKKNIFNQIIFDPGGGGSLEKNFFYTKVIDGGHVWFPKYELVKKIFIGIPFSEIKFLHYYDERGVSHTSPIDYSQCWVKRTPDNDERVRSPYRAMSIVVDCIK